jgi:hypothetical protein
MPTFLEFASDEQIIKLLIKERVKVALNNGLKEIDTPGGYVSAIAREVAPLMPPRPWKKPRRQERLCVDTGKKRTNKQILMRSLALTIKAHRKEASKHPYLRRLDDFVQSIQAEIRSTSELSFRESIHIVGKPKKIDSSGVHILRPLCTFNALRDKILIALVNSYLSEVFDPLLHEEVLAYRPLRFYHNSNTKVLTDRDNSIDNLQKYRRCFAEYGVYVAECDIQKYFDTINHDVIRRYFDDFARQVEQKCGDFGYRYTRRILDAYLNSYSFYNSVVNLNEELLKGSPAKMFEAPKDSLFIERGCYSQAEFEASKGKIGIPQGGALSGLISNVILSSIDKRSVLAKNDRQLFFSRYGDDILLMHPNKEVCQQLIDAYRKELTQNKLLYHEFVNVSDEGYMHPDGRTLPAVWSQKSRNPFLWGRSASDRNAMDWIGFLGYEVRYTGEVRLRRSSFDDKMKNIKRKYYKAAQTQLAKGNDAKISEDRILKKINYFKSDGLAKAKSLNRNRYSTTQAKKLDAYTNLHIYKLLYKIAKNNALSADQFTYYWQQAKEGNYANYTETITPR